MPHSNQITFFHKNMNYCTSNYTFFSQISILALDGWRVSQKVFFRPPKIFQKHKKTCVFLLDPLQALENFKIFETCFWEKSISDSEEGLLKVSKNSKKSKKPKSEQLIFAHFFCSKKLLIKVVLISTTLKKWGSITAT